MHYLNPGTLSGTQEVLASQLVEGLSDGRAVRLQPRLAMLLAEVAAGFFERARETILLEQEQVKAALLSERRQVEEALRKSEASLAEAQRIVHLGHYDYDPINDKLHWSDEIYRIFGVTKQEFGGTFEDYFERVHPEDRKFIEKASEEAIGGGSVSLEHRILRPSGEVRVVQHRLQFVFDDEQRAFEGEAGGTDGEGEDESKEFRNRIFGTVPRTPGGLPGKPVRVIGTVQDITERKVLEDRLEHLALHDPLTDLPNRTLFLDRLKHALSRRDRPEESIAVLFLDLDGFKLVNDSFGHVVGDQLLLKVASRLEACVRPQDTVARFGGDEFTVLLEDATGVNTGTLVAKRIIEELRTPFVLREQEVYVTASIGIVSRTSKRDLPEDLTKSGHCDVSGQGQKQGQLRSVRAEHERSCLGAA